MWIINLENKDYDTTWRNDSDAEYLTKTLRPKGQLLTEYYGIAHNSLGNYIAEISGQGVNRITQLDCIQFQEFKLEKMEALGQAKGEGCLYPKSIPTIANQLHDKGLTWKGYMEDLDAGTRGRTGDCPHPEVGGADPTHAATKGDQYATRHNPFAYFRAVLELPDCKERVVPLGALERDLQAVDTTPNYAMITPNLCNDAHDEPCVTGEPGGLVTADKWLEEWVPKILGAPAFKQDGMLIITFDEAEADNSDPVENASCCDQRPGPNVEEPGQRGPGGGRIGALVLSPLTKPGSENKTPYNHYSMLCSMEEAFGLDKIGFAAQPGLKCFGADVYNG